MRRDPEYPGSDLIEEAPSRVRTAAVLGTSGVLAAAGLVVGVAILLLVPPLGLLLLYLAVITIFGLVRTARSPSEGMLRRLCSPWLALLSVIAFWALLTLVWVG